MTSTVFVDKSTVIEADWLQDVNDHVYAPPAPPVDGTLGGLTIGSITLDSTTPLAKITTVDTNPLGWSADIGTMYVEFDITFNGYFAANPNGHMAVVTRCNTSVIETSVQGQGIAIGNATGFPAYPNTLNPTVLLETWMNAPLVAPVGSYTYPNSETARSLGLQDNVPYKIGISSSKADDGNRYIRYRLWSVESYGEFKLQRDTGDVLDFNVWADLTQSGLTFGYVFSSDLYPWSIDITNLRVVWGPFEKASSDLTYTLSRYGAQMEGDLEFIGLGRRILVPDNAGPSLVDSLTVQASVLNAATTLVFKPNGTAKIANVIFSNDGASDTAYQALVVGAEETRTAIKSFNLGLTNLDIDIEVGLGNKVASFDDVGVSLPAAMRLGVAYNAGPSLLTSTFIQSTTPNTPTNLVVKPNGFASTATLMFSNNSTSDTVYDSLVIGVTSTEAVLSTLTAGGGTALDIALKPGGVVTATITPTGIKMFAATKTIGVVIGWSTNLTSWGGTNANTYSTTANISVDSSCAVGTIAGIIGGTYSAAAIETVVRPLWCMLSFLVKNLQDKKVI